MIRVRPNARVDADVVVVGAGPAGAACAARLARTGLDVALVDRSRFPRDKVCGDFVSPAALVELEDLGVGASVGFGETNVVRRAALHLDGRLLVERDLPALDEVPAHGRVIPRLTLDSWIVDAAVREGARLVDEFDVGRVEHEPAGVVQVVERGRRARILRSRLVVGADGSNSTVARLLRGSSPPPDDRIIAVRAYYSDVLGPSERADLFFAGASFPGYTWLFPTGADTANVGVGMALATLPPTREHLRDLLLRLVAHDTALSVRLAKGKLEGKIVGWPLTTYNPALPVVADGLLLVGDAAGLINALNGEGIQYALLSARWAADAVTGALGAGDASVAALRPYADRIAGELRYDLGFARLIVRLISNRTLNPVWLLALRVIAERARVDKAYAETTGGVLAGLVPAQRTLAPDVVARTIEQAFATAGVETARQLVRRPRSAAGVGVDVARTAFGFAYDAARDRRALTHWAMSSAATAAGLARTASLDAGRASGRRVVGGYRSRSTM